MAYNLGGRIILDDAFSGPISRLIQQSGQGEDALRRMGQAGDNAGSTVGRGSSVAEVGLGALSKAAALAGTAFAAWQTAEKVMELGRMGAEAITVRNSFDTLTQSVGVNSQLLNQLQASAGGVIGELDLMRLTNAALVGTSGDLAQALGDALPQLLEMSRAAAKLNPAMGDASFMFQSLVTGIRRGSPMILDNLGLTIKVGQANEEFAAQLGKSVDELTGQEKQIALLNATLAEYDTFLNQVGGNLESLTGDSARLKIAWQELRQAVGEALAPKTTGFEGALAQALDVVRVRLFGDEMETLRVRIAELKSDIAATQDIPILNLQVPALKRQLAEAEAELERLTASAAAADAAQAAFAAGTGLSAVQIQGMVDAVANGTMSLDEMNTQLALYAGNASDAEGASLSLADALAIVGDTADAKAASIERINTALSGIEKDITAATRRIAGLGEDISEDAASALLSRTQSQLLELEMSKGDMTELQYERRKSIIENSLNDELAAYRQHSSQVSQTYGGMVDDMSRKIEGMIGKELTPSFDLAGLTGGALGGGDERNIDEHYRRLAAIALRGGEELMAHAEDWQDTLAQIPPDVQAQGVGAIQEWARGMVEAYDAGLDFSLIDRDAIKQRILSQLQADQVRQEVINELMGELGGDVSVGQLQAAAGVALGGGEALAAQTPVQDQGASAAGWLVEGLEVGLAGYDVGSIVSTAWSADFTQSQPVFQAVGRNTGEVMAGAFVEAVEDGIGNVRQRMAAIIAPEVADILAAQQNGASSLP